MSLIVPVYVNNTKVGEVTITRQEELKSVRQVHTYHWDAKFKPLNGNGRPAAKWVQTGGTVKHRYDRGWAALVAKVLAGLDTGYRLP